MDKPKTKLITLYYDPATKRMWSRGKFVSLKEFVEYPPNEQNEILPPPGQSVPDPPDPEPGPVLKCINGIVHICYNDRCYPTGMPC